MITEHFCTSCLINDHAKVSHNTLWMSNNSHARIGSTTRFLYSCIRGISDSAYVSDYRSINGYKAADHMDGDCGKAIASLAVLMPSF
ncbi:hypothetical protein [Nitrosomonas communis]|uniref:Uncharacterized protein n=1 Tax=Nitrosomonas communis TaxID=44574 RepID=A0A1I4UI39_9PROT|nr:hypothetical protein [Nitrosomonas communis]SFM88373.1 hypothetical protein SAMN05421863_10653 [Nitrosomonas communis]